MSREYIGDGVYASIDGYMIKLETEREGGILHVIYLEPEVYAALHAFGSRHGFKTPRRGGIMRLFDTPGADAAYDRWLTTTPEDRAHPCECNCEKCHEWHIDEGVVIENAVDWGIDFQCCVDEFDLMVEKKQVCRTHPKSYFEPATKTEPAHCEGCEPEYFK